MGNISQGMAASVMKKGTTELQVVWMTSLLFLAITWVQLKLKVLLMSILRFAKRLWLDFHTI
jgi:hypothetical protein